jgi:hypothetical protein
MIYSVINPVGIDVPIRGIQNDLYNGLKNLWNLTGGQIRAFPRAYRSDDKIVSETVTALTVDSTLITIDSDLGTSDSEGTYEPIKAFFDDRFALQFFFLDSDKRDFVSQSQVIGSHFVVPCEIYFFVNLSVCKPLLKHRADEEVRQDIYNIVKMRSEQFIGFDGIDLGEYNGKMNMNPYMSFKVITNLIYRYDKTN